MGDWGAWVVHVVSVGVSGRYGGWWWWVTSVNYLFGNTNLGLVFGQELEIPYRLREKKHPNYK